jgi:AraC-like DNA-binding protein
LTASTGTSPHTIAVHQVVQMLLGVKEESARATLLSKAGISPALLESDLSRVTQAQFARLMAALLRHHRDEFWGLGSQPLPLGTFASCSRMLVGQRKLGEALRAGLRYYHALLPDFVPRLVVQSGVAYVRLSPKRAMNARQVYAVRVFMFLGYGVMCWLAARRIPVNEVVYPDHETLHRSDASRLFQASIHLSDGEWGFRFDAKWLDLPVVQNLESVEAFLQQAPACLLVKYRDQASLTERIRRMLRRYLTEEMPSLEVISQMLATTPQTLRRRLQREGQGYQLIKDALRRDVAVEYLTQTNLPLLDVAAKVGFSEASTFHRAFKGWTGLTPGAYRQAHNEPVKYVALSQPLFCVGAALPPP